MNQSRPKVRRSRALGIPLTPKDVRYFERRPYPPGEHGRKRKNTSDYKTRLMEKQRLRAQYDVSETQLRSAFDRARRAGGKTGEELITHQLEARLDATVLRAGFARTIYQARQTVSHQHVTVNGKRVDRPSYQVQPYDVIEIAEKSKSKLPFQVAASGAHAAAPSYLEVQLAQLRCTVLRRPRRDEVPVICEEQLVVEHYSR
ncbi:30S ribosomal protein S4 [uncultured Modestobacter sp.]|uniref:30S ribosomal protein S4 n=1 Tax=uncultured Modestobacter sp. TaxID=380048 RepID=UPI00260BF71A|nr:30S ribosomal protein S4 [uncultured Modestobacter sp.]